MRSVVYLIMVLLQRLSRFIGSLGLKTEAWYYQLTEAERA